MTNNIMSSSSFAGAFDVGQMDALEQRGELEASLMQQATVGVLGEEGKKKNSKKKQKEKKQKASLAARTLFQDGVVQLNGILSDTTAASLREEILERRDAAYAAVESESGEDEWRKYFADVLLKGHRNQRCDLLLPLKGWHSLQLALHELLAAKSNLLPSTLMAALGGNDDATLYELSALISEPGSSRQPVHPDNPHQEEPPLFTVFVALQDITTDMGPTSFIPRSHNAEAHAAYNDVPQGRDDLLRNKKSVVALLKAGDASLFDSRSLHCGGANDAAMGATRVLLYMSFRNPRATEPIGNVGSIMPDIPRMTLAEFRTKLAAASAQSSDCKDDVDLPFDPFDDEQEKKKAMGDLYLNAKGGDALAQLQLGTNYYLGEGGFETDLAESVRWFELAAAQGNARAQFNLGFCFSTGQGMPQRDLQRAAELFRLASEQNHPGGKEVYEETLRELEQVREDQ
eukprot:CAMPEP_0172300798 /NCGR_PEP_ID=MMETSP1058-20130122/2815_1 /TAXON_ID=83371 /ORGANISM="Detonula confervacea, Strain CCMP 353" /LENGTH=457 /DNA_ID=CAMNT_0013010699 /DNA_START=283 /DNA_END=1656 /DNA_ORIENTATION=-